MESSSLTFIDEGVITDDILVYWRKHLVGKTIIALHEDDDGFHTLFEFSDGSFARMADCGGLEFT